MATSPSEASPAPLRLPGPVAGRRVLVANRGEIACRVLRAVREEGGVGIAVFSDADLLSPHVRLADEAVRLGPPPVGESYLNPQVVLEAARRSRADMIHPGYGFFSENGDFAEAAERAGLTWIGPTPDAIRTMGDKIAARRAVLQSKVPVVPGSEMLSGDRDAMVARAEEIGYPVLVKAAFGGGGKGMRSCATRQDLLAAVDLAQAEALRAFGNATVYLEKLITQARHVEIQILADAHGHVVHLGERECSIQRRHQKLLEETPTTAPFPGLRDRMGEAAVAIARSIGYVNAGTVEFLVDATGKFYFLEVNTRLQVEHPITELTTGIDIARRQLRIALGEPLDLTQEQISWRGHAIECRVNAEDPEKGFLPATGRILSFEPPSGAGVRLDFGVTGGTEVTPHYDSLLGKLIVWGENRPHAIERASRALRETRIAGVRTNLGFHRWLLAHPRFLSGEIDTGFVAEEFRPGTTQDEQEQVRAVIAAALAAYHGEPGERSGPAAQTGSAWKYLGRPGGGARGCQ
jgi:acetyl-CoA carboxylase biotin carboxylase subunit